MPSLSQVTLFLHATLRCNTSEMDGISVARKCLDEFDTPRCEGNHAEQQ